MAEHLKGTQAGCDLLFPFLEGFVAKLEDPATVGTNQMVVNVRFPEERIEASNAVTEVSGLSQTILDQDLERPVDRSVADPRVLGLDDVVEFLNADVLVEFEKLGDDEIALPGGLQTSGRSPGSKFFEGFCDVLRAQTLRLLGSIGTHQGWTLA